MVLALTVVAQPLDSVQILQLDRAAQGEDTTAWNANIDLSYHFGGERSFALQKAYLDRALYLADLLEEADKWANTMRRVITNIYSQQLWDSLFHYKALIEERINAPYSEDEQEAMYALRFHEGKYYMYHQYDYEKAYAKYQQAVPFAQRLRSATRYLEVSWNMANLYYAQEEDEKCLAILDSALAEIKTYPKPPSIRQINGIKTMRIIVVGNGNANASRRRQAANDCLEIVDYYLSNNPNSPSVVGNITNTIAYFSNVIGLDSSLMLAQIAQQVINADPLIMNNNNFQLAYAKLLVEDQQYQAAQRSLDAFDYEGELRDNDFVNLVDFTSLSTEVYTQLGNKAGALENFANYRNFVDSLNAQKQANAIEDIEVKYELEQEKTANTLLQAENSAIQARSQGLTIIGGLLALLLLAGGYFYYRLQRNKNELARVNNAKNQLFAILAHDLKGPTLAFNNLSSKLSLVLRSGDHDRLLQLAEYFEDKGRRVNYVIDNLLNWALSQKDEFSHNPIELHVRAEIDAIKQELAYALEDKRIVIDITLSQDMRCIFDPNAFKVVMRNLLHNAIKYSEADSTILIEGNIPQKWIKITDEGHGMAPDIATNIMAEKPVQSQIGTADETGNGIGLITCVKLVKNNNGHMTFTAGKSGGTTVEIQLA